MLSFGRLEKGQGNETAASCWYEKAVATGHRGRFGYLAYADPQLMSPASDQPDISQPATDEREASTQ
jgi:hypothetical protein